MKAHQAAKAVLRGLPARHDAAVADYKAVLIPRTTPPTFPETPPPNPSYAAAHSSAARNAFAASG